ncbi:recombinase family protein [Ruminococcaceae bacterium OttesenSCG-928-I18]|nr:recombinase family protein [Ruminococcaceae bacterium OttesenSCG-928-I18]
MKQPNEKNQYLENPSLDRLMTMQDITVLYLRISREDDRDGESYSIENQRRLLLDVAEKNDFHNLVCLTDDGISGVTDKRPEFQKLMATIKADRVKMVIVKDMSRLGRNYLSVGEYVEYLFPSHNVRLIAVNDGVDTINGVDDFTPFRNLMNEWYAKDISRKRRSTNITLDKQGKPIGQPPYGYKWDANSAYWEIDEEAAEVVKRIFSLKLQGNSLGSIAGILRAEKVFIPTVYLMMKGLRKPQKHVERGNYFWNTSTVSHMLKNQKYCGDVVNFQTYSRSYKLKDRLRNPKEKWSVHPDVHPPIIDRDTFEQVQKTFATTKMRSPKDVPKHMLAGYLVCSDCGKNLHYKLTYPNNANHYFSCGNNRVSKTLCPLSHHIRVDTIMEATVQMIARVTQFARDYEDEFVKIVVSEKYKMMQLEQEQNKKELQRITGRQGELEILFTRLYEDRTLGVLPESVFLKMSKMYTEEQAELDAKAVALQKTVDSDNAHKLDVDKFLQMVRKYTAINELTPEVLRHFIDKIVVHHREETKEGRTQRLDFHFNFIGKVDIPTLHELARYKKSFGRKKENHTAKAV